MKWWAMALVSTMMAVLLPGRAVAMTDLPNGGGTATTWACTPVIFLGARGSGQPTGLGTQLATIANTVQRTLARQQTKHGMTKLSVRYPAAAVSTLTPKASVLTSRKPLQKYWSTSVDAYMDSIFSGTSSFRWTLVTVLQRCPKSKVLVAGYSQGAMALHKAINLIAADKSRAGLLRRLYGGVFVADGYRLKNSKVGLMGGAPRSGYGIAMLPTGAAIKEVPTPGKFLNVCAKGDVVCDGSSVISTVSKKVASAGRIGVLALPLPGAAPIAAALSAKEAKGAITAVQRGISIHSGYSSSTLTEAGVWLAGKV